MDTIYALSTPPGKSGVAVIRVSGPLSKQTFDYLGLPALPSPRKATLASLKVQGETLDKALVLYFTAPHSFTGEDMAEYHTHGSRAVIRSLLDAFSHLPGLRPAEPGEFTLRAFLHGKMDLTAAEGLADLIDAETEAQRKQAMRFMQGAAAAFYQSLRQETLEALALMEATIDFPDEEIPPQVLEEVRKSIAALLARIDAQLSDKGAAERVRDGVQIAIIGPPNAGKSSLMNLLAQRDVAIVSETAGTTRDVIEVHLDISGYAVVIADTAGLREGETDVEREGIRRSLARAEGADIRIIVLDATEVSDQWSVTSNVLSQITDHGSQATILLLNKTDLALPSPFPSIAGLTPLPFSARTGSGTAELLAALSERILALAPTESSYIGRARHRRHLSEAANHLRAFLSLPQAGLELQCEELRRSAVETGKITGAIGPEEILGHIFSRFCIGK